MLIISVHAFQFAARTGPGEGVAFVQVPVVVVEAVVTAEVLTVGRRELSGGRVDAVAFREAEDVAFEIAVDAMTAGVEGVWVEG